MKAIDNFKSDTNLDSLKLDASRGNVEILSNDNIDQKLCVRFFGCATIMLRICAVRCFCRRVSLITFSFDSHCTKAGPRGPYMTQWNVYLAVVV